MNLLETLLALLAGLACAAALALCAHDLRARTQALQEAELLQGAARQALAYVKAHAGELAERLNDPGDAPGDASGDASETCLLPLEASILPGLAQPPEGRSLHVALAACRVAAGTGNDVNASPAEPASPRPRLRLFVWLEGADPALAARAALALPRGWHADGQGRLVWPNAGASSRTSLAPACAGQAGQTLPSPLPGAFGTELLVQVPASALPLAVQLAQRREAAGARHFVRRTWSPPSALSAQPASSGAQGASVQANGPAVPAMRQPLDLQGHSLLATASLGLGLLEAGASSAAPESVQQAALAGEQTGEQADQQTGQQTGEAGASQAVRLQALAEAGLDAVEQACLNGGLEGVLARGQEQLFICRQRRLLPLLAREDRPSLAGIASFAAGETPPGEPLACPAGRRPAVFYTPVAAESRSLEAELSLGTTRVFRALFEGPVDQSFQWLAIQACL